MYTSRQTNILVLGILFLLLLLTAQVCAAEDKIAAVEDEFLPQTEFFRPLIADQREYLFSIQYQRRDQNHETFDAAEVSFGDSLPLKNFALDSGGAIQLTFDGAVYSVYDLDTESYDLVNADYLVGMSVVYRIEQWSTRLQLRHKSSHLGDEYLLNHPEVERDNSSYEEVRGLVGYEWADWRAFGGMGAIIRKEHYEDPLSFQTGAEKYFPTSRADVNYFLASDFQVTQRSDWQLNLSCRGGIELGNKNKRVVRLALLYANGKAQDGQFESQNSEYYGAGVFFQL